MSMRRRILLLLAVALLAAVLCATFHSSAEPSYQGCSLSGWLAEFDRDLTNRAGLFLGGTSPEKHRSESAMRRLQALALTPRRAECAAA